MVVRMTLQRLDSSQLELTIVAKAQCSKITLGRAIKRGRAIATPVSLTWVEGGMRCKASCLCVTMANFNSCFSLSLFPIVLRLSPSWTVTLSPSDDNHLISTSHCRLDGFTLGKDSLSLLTSQETFSFPNQLKRKNRRAQCNRWKRKLFWHVTPAQVTQPHVALRIKLSQFWNMSRGQDHRGKTYRLE